MSFRVLALTFHHQLSQVDLLVPSQVPDVMLHQVVVARKNCHYLDLVCFVSQASSRSICLCGEIKKRAVWQTSNKVLETDGFCVRNAAQSFLRLGKRTQMLYSTPNKRSTLCDPDNTFHTNAFSGRFSFLNQYTCRSKKNTIYYFSNPCVCQISNTSNIHLAAQCLQGRA